MTAPLRHQVILNTRPAHQQAELSAMLEADGALSRRCNVLIDGRSARHLPEGIETRIAAADEVDVFPAIAGG